MCRSIRAGSSCTPRTPSRPRSTPWPPAGAGVVLCPTTEANLGDGLPDLPRWLAAAVPLSIGSDSQVTRDWREEIRLLEYGQRLTLRRRNVAATPEAGEPSCAARLFERLLAGGAAAAGLGAGACSAARAPIWWWSTPPTRRCSIAAATTCSTRWCSRARRGRSPA